MRLIILEPICFLSMRMLEILKSFHPLIRFCSSEFVRPSSLVLFWLTRSSLVSSLFRSFVRSLFRWLVGWFVLSLFRWLLSLFRWSVRWFVGSSLDWLVGWLFRSFVVSLFRCFVDSYRSFVGWFVGSFVGWLVDSLFRCFGGWFVGWFVVSLIRFFVGWLDGSLVRSVHSLVRSSVGFMVGSLVGWLVRCFVGSLFGWFVRPLVRSFRSLLRLFLRWFLDSLVVSLVRCFFDLLVRSSVGSFFRMLVRFLFRPVVLFIVRTYVHKTTLHYLHVERSWIGEKATIFLFTRKTTHTNDKHNEFWTRLVDFLLWGVQYFSGLATGVQSKTNICIMKNRDERIFYEYLCTRCDVIQTLLRIPCSPWADFRTLLRCKFFLQWKKNHASLSNHGITIFLDLYTAYKLYAWKSLLLYQKFNEIRVNLGEIQILYTIFKRFLRFLTLAKSISKALSLQDYNPLPSFFRLNRWRKVPCVSFHFWMKIFFWEK